LESALATDSNANKVAKVANFRLQKTALQRTTIHHKSTTISPSKHHEKHAIFPQPPSKKAPINPAKTGLWALRIL
jgi:hypothetical protein